MEIDTSAPEMLFADSDDEREYKESQKNQATTEFTFSAQEPAQGVLVVLQGGLSQATSKILHEDSWQLVGTGKASYKDEKDAEKTDEVCKVYQTSNKTYFLVPESGKLKGSFVNQLVESLVSKKTFTSFLILDDIYQTQYQSQHDHSAKPLIFYKNSFVPDDKTIWLSTVGHPAHFMAATSGIGAALLVHAEMNGLPGIKVTALTDSHYYSSEMMQDAYQRVFDQFSLGDLRTVQSLKSFRSVLKEANQRGHSIFS